jgi:hypothetical protein
MKGIQFMKNRNIQITTVLFLVGLALAPLAGAKPLPDGGPSYTVANEAPQPGGGPTLPSANEGPRPDGGPVSGTVSAGGSSDYQTNNEGEIMPVVTIHSTGDVTRGKTGSFVLQLKPALMFGATFVNFKVGGTAIPGVDYVALVSPAFIGQSGYATILIQTLPDPRGPANGQSYSVVVMLKDGLGYALGVPSSATIWIKP